MYFDPKDGMQVQTDFNHKDIQYYEIYNISEKDLKDLLDILGSVQYAETRDSESERLATLRERIMRILTKD